MILDIYKLYRNDCSEETKQLNQIVTVIKDNQTNEKIGAEKFDYNTENFNEEKYVISE